MDNIKKFEGFLDRMQGLLDNAKKQGHIIVRVEDLENAFPELKESEDKEIKEMLKVAVERTPWMQEKKEKCYEWLEAQGEQKPADKVEPKFKVGDWVVRNGETLQISGIDTVLDGTFHYWFTKGTWLSSKKMKNAMLWTIQDANDGDVLAVENRPFIYNGKIDPLSVGGYCGITIDGLLKINEERPGYGSKGWTMFNTDIYPATKEQREQLEKAIADAGYTFDFEKKELKKIEQKVAWSEEDEKHIMAIDLAVNRCDGKWNCCGEKCPISEHSPWLKSLKDRYTWKPSDLQIEALNRAMYHVEDDVATQIAKLIGDLKKLKGE